MTSHRFGHAIDVDARAGTIYGFIAAVVAGGGLLLFWIMGAILLFNGNGGQIQFLHDEPLWRTLYFAYPIVFVVALLVGGALAALGRDLEAVGAAGTPVVLAVLYYFALIHLGNL